MASTDGSRPAGAQDTAALAPQSAEPETQPPVEIPKVLGDEAAGAPIAAAPVEGAKQGPLAGEQAGEEAAATVEGAPVEGSKQEPPAGEQAAAAAAAPMAAAPVEGAKQEAPADEPAGPGASEGEPAPPSAAGRKKGNKAKGGAKATRRAAPQHKGQAKRAKEEAADTDPEGEAGKEGGGLPRRRSSRTTKKAKTYAEEYITEPDPEGSENPEGLEQKEDEDAMVILDGSEGSDAEPLLKLIKTEPVKAEDDRAEAASKAHADEAKSPKGKRKRQQEAGQGDASEQAEGADAKAAAEEAKSPRVRLQKGKVAGKEGTPDKAAGGQGKAANPNIFQRKRAKGAAAAGKAPAADGGKTRSREATPVEPNQAAGKPAAAAETIQTAANEAAAEEAAGKPAAVKGRQTKDREATAAALEQAADEPTATEAKQSTAASEQAPAPASKEDPPATSSAARSQKEPVQESSGRPAQKQPAQQRAGSGQPAPPKAGPMSELERITEGLLKAVESHDKLMVDLKKLDIQVKGYMEHLDRMSLTVGQLKLTGIGKPLKKIRKWLTERETTTGSSENSACELAQRLFEKWSNIAGVSAAPRGKQTAKKPGTSAHLVNRIPSSAGEAKQKARGAAAANAEPGLPAHTERGFPPREEGGPAQPGRAASALADPPLAPQAPQPEPKVVAIGLKQEEPAPVRRPQPSRAEPIDSTGSAVRDKAVGILLNALAPDEALSREEAARKLEAALYASCTNGKTAGQPVQPAEPGVTYMRRLKVLWSWLDGGSPHRSPGLKRMFLAGKVAAPDLATMDARRVRDLTEPSAASATPHTNSQPEADGTPAGTAPRSTEAPYAKGPAQQVMDMEVDPPSQGIPASALLGQQVLAKLQGLCEGTLPLTQPNPGHLQGFAEEPLHQTISDIIHGQEAALRACQAGAATPEQLHGVIAAGRLLERSLGAASQGPAAAQPAAVLAPAEAQLQLQPFAQAALAALTSAAAAPDQAAPDARGVPLRTALPTQAAAAMQHIAAHEAAPPPPAEPVDGSSAPDQAMEEALPLHAPESNGVAGPHEQGGALDLAASLPRESPQTPVMGGGHAAPERAAAQAQPGAGGDHLASMHAGPAVHKGSKTGERLGPSLRMDLAHVKTAGLLQPGRATPQPVKEGGGKAAEEPALA